jgi:hypothetical protein
LGYSLRAVERSLGSAQKKEIEAPKPKPKPEECDYFITHLLENRMLDAGVISVSDMSVCDGNKCDECAPIKRRQYLLKEAQMQAEIIEHRMKDDERRNKILADLKKPGTQYVIEGDDMPIATYQSQNDRIKMAMLSTRKINKRHYRDMNGYNIEVTSAMANRIPVQAVGRYEVMSTGRIMATWTWNAGVEGNARSFAMHYTPEGFERQIRERRSNV